MHVAASTINSMYRISGKQSTTLAAPTLVRSPSLISVKLRLKTVDDRYHPNPALISSSGTFGRQGPALVEAESRLRIDVERPRRGEQP
jgi:hypothetical protein